MTTWAEVKQEALNDYCAAMRRHNIPDALVALYREAIDKALMRLRYTIEDDADWEWGHRLP